MVYNKIYSLIDVGGAPFPLVCTNQAWTTHHINPCGPSCAYLCIHSSLTIGDKGKYVDPTQEATGSLTSQATSLWSC